MSATALPVKLSARYGLSDARSYHGAYNSPSRKIACRRETAEKNRALFRQRLELEHQGNCKRREECRTVLFEVRKGSRWPILSHGMEEIWRITSF
jgi:hypothetical protein